MVISTSTHSALLNREKRREEEFTDVMTLHAT
jgi:ssRNA-specific RNase YbeY (16S rRNA maturation enzyme)